MRHWEGYGHYGYKHSHPNQIHGMIVVSVLSYLDTPVGYRAGTGVGCEENHVFLEPDRGHHEMVSFQQKHPSSRCQCAQRHFWGWSTSDPDLRHGLPAGTCPGSRAQEESFVVFVQKNRL